MKQLSMIYLILLGLILWGCTGPVVQTPAPLPTLAFTSTPEPTLEPVSSTPTPRLQLTPTSTPWKKYPSARKEDGLLKWTRIADLKANLDHGVTDGTLVVWIKFAGGENDLWTDVAAPKVIHRGLLFDVLIGPDRRFYFNEAFSTESVQGFRIYRYDPETQEEVKIEEFSYPLGENPMVEGMRMNIGKTHLIWHTFDQSKKETCVRTYNLETEETQTLDCFDEHYDFYEAQLTWPWVIYSYHQQRDDDTWCGMAQRKNLETGEQELWGDESCFVFQAAGGENFVIWSELKPQKDGTDYHRAQMYGRDQDGKIWDLGLGTAGSIQVCNERAYWMVGTGINEVRTWKPGESIKVIYRAPSENYASFTLRCVGDVVSLHRSKFVENTTQPVQDEILYAVMP